VLSEINLLKQEAAEPSKDRPAKTPEEQLFRDLWRRYHDSLRQVAAVDFDDLLVLLVRLFEEHEEARRKYQHRYRYVLIDEYQDTNRAQYLIARHLCGGQGNLFVVGDEDQSIYSWRGADIRNILNFETDFNGARVFRLEQNYRSTAPILDVANAVVGHNTKRLGKKLWTAIEGGGPVRHRELDSGEDEARFVIGDMVDRNLPPRECAVLYRTNSQSRVIEEALRKRGIAYVVLGGIKFYARKEIKDILSYLRLLVNPADDVSLRRILNVPTRGIGATTQEHIEEYALARKMNLFAVLREIEHDLSLPLRARNALTEFVQLIDDLAIESKNAGLPALLDSLLERTGYREFVRASDEKDYRARLDIVDEFLVSCAQFDQTNETGGLAEFLQDLALATDVDDWDPAAPAVTLMTCHSAKGLEFDHVYLIGLEEGLLPHATSLDSLDEIEEERRLCYVAMTRARKSLTLTSARLRTLFGQEESRESSRFLSEIPPERLAVVENRVVAAARPPEFPKAESGKMRLGCHVRHARFGEGIVTQVAGAGNKMKVTVRFRSGQARTLLVSVAPLEILEGHKR
jgi:DNA helicase-2/ATP-dependent DNA helicase PcrA